METTSWSRTSKSASSICSTVSSESWSPFTATTGTPSLAAPSRATNSRSATVPLEVTSPAMVRSATASSPR